MNKAHLGLIILTLTCLQWGWVTPRQAQAQTQTPQFALATNLTPNQQIISDLKVFLDNQRRDFGNTPLNNAYLRQIQNLINRYQSVGNPPPGGNQPPVGNPPPVGNTRQCQYVITVNTGTHLQSPNFNKLGDGPGTDANVWFTVTGTNGKQVRFGPISGARNAHRNGTYYFEMGNQDRFGPQVDADVGSLREISIRRDNQNSSSSDWQVDSITVEKQSLNGTTIETKTIYPRRWILDTQNYRFQF